MKKLRDDATAPALKRLMHDHKRIRKLLRRAGRAKGQAGALAADVELACKALSVHDEVEERMLYPALRRVPAAREATVEAEVTHDLVRQLAADLEAMGCDDERYLATVRLMRMLVDHHIEEEEDRLFTLVRTHALDLSAIEQAFEDRAAADADAATEADEDVLDRDHVLRAPDDPAEVRQRARGPGRRGAH